jgi:tetratricopeptide (TPR) repeat protein
MDKLEWLKQLTVKEPDNAQNWYWLGQEYIQAGQMAEALNALAESLKHASEADKEQISGALSNAAALLYQRPSIVPTTTAADPDEAEPVVNDVFREESKLPPHTAAGFKVIDGGRLGKPDIRPEDTISFKDVAGLNKLKQTIHLKIVSPFQNKGLFAKFRKKTGGGVLLYGPPGCGKTFVAKATAGECGASFYSVHITDILDPYIGNSERNLKAAFDRARSHKPSILFFDEIYAGQIDHNKIA